MNKRNIKAFFKLTLTFTLIFAIVAATVFAVAINMMDGEIFGITVGENKIGTHMNVLLVGVDKGGTRADVMILGQLNMVDNTITMIQIPRDTYVPDNGRWDKKINSSYGAGNAAMFREVEMVTGVKIDKYVKVDTSQFRDIIDEIGGVYYDVPINMNYDDLVQDLHIHLNKGYQLLNGDQAEQFVRFRQNNNGSGYARGDIERLEVQQGFIKEAVKQLFSFKNTLKIPNLVSLFMGMMETNFTNAELIAIAPHIFDIPHENITIITLEGESQTIGGGSYFVPSYDENRELIEMYFYGENETDSGKESETNN